MDFDVFLCDTLGESTQVLMVSISALPELYKAAGGLWKGCNRGALVALPGVKILAYSASEQ
jgi:hypothetical protein